MSIRIYLLNIARVIGSGLLAIVLVAVTTVQTGGYLLAQQKPEKELSTADLRRPEVAALVERLKALRKNESLYGPKHPALPSLQKQIASLESQLRETTGKATPVEPLSQTSILPDGTGLQAEKIPDRKIAPNHLKSSFADPKGWGFNSLSNWPPTVNKLVDILKDNSVFQEAYPWLGLRDMVAVGPMPSMGLMWGIQYDSRVDRSCVYQWFDSSGSWQKICYFEAPGRMISIYFPKSFDRDGRFWVLQEKSQEARVNVTSDRIDWRRLEVTVVQADRQPPYQIQHESSNQLDHMELLVSNSTQIIPSQQKGWFFIGDIEHSDSSKLAVKGIDALTKIKEGAWAFDYRQDDLSIPAEIAETSDFSSGFLSSTIQSGRRIQNAGFNSVGGKLLIDRFGIVIEPKLDHLVNPLKVEWAPRKLSQLGWYSSLADGEMLDCFRKFIPDRDFEISDPERSCLSSVFESQTIGLEGLVAEYWFCLPQNSMVCLNEQGSLIYPDGTIFVQTISTSMEKENEQTSSRRIETRVLVLADHEWFALRYLWDKEQSDAELVRSQEQEQLQTDRDESAIARPTVESLFCFACHRDGTITKRPNGIGLETANYKNDRELHKYLPWEHSIIGRKQLKRKIDWAPILARGKGWVDIQSNQETDLNQESSAAFKTFDWSWFKESFVTQNIEPWYRASFRPTGFFCTELDQSWTPKPQPTATLVSQSRLIYTMAMGYSVTEDPRFLDAMHKGIVFLREKFGDNTNGGYFYQVNEKGQVIDRSKDGYGHAFVIYSLATAAKVSREARYSDEALKCWEVLRSRMMESDGGLMWKAAEDFSVLNRRSQTPNMQLLEGLLELYDATKDPGLYEDSLLLLNFVVDRLRDDSGVIPENFQGDWDTPVLIDQKPYIERGHQVEWAFLISRAVELGFPRRYLKVGNELMDYTMEHGYDPQSGGVREPSGAKGSWQQAEFLRALMRYFSMHGKTEYLGPIRRTQELIQRDFIDRQYGGWIELEKKEKGNHWKSASHEVAMYIEGIRVEKQLKSNTGDVIE